MSILHVGQIDSFLHFDQEVRTRGGIQGIEATPLGFSEFSMIWNDGIRKWDPCRISQVTVTDKPDDYFIEPSTHPVTIRDFFMTPAQLRLVPYSNPALESNITLNDDIVREYAALMLKKQRNQKQAFEEREQKRAWALRDNPRFQASPYFAQRNHRSRAPRTRRTDKPFKAGAPIPKVILDDSTTVQYTDMVPSVPHPTPVVEAVSDPMETTH